MLNTPIKVKGPSILCEIPIVCIICVCGIVIVPVCFICEKIYDSICWIGRKIKTRYLKNKNKKVNI